VEIRKRLAAIVVGILPAVSSFAGNFSCIGYSGQAGLMLIAGANPAPIDCRCQLRVTSDERRGTNRPLSIVHHPSVYIPNASFESPQTTFVSVNIDSWQKPAKPLWYDESVWGLWDQLTGVFLNLPTTDPDHIDNCDGNQAAWLFAVPEVELYQDLMATFEVGQSYRLTVGIFGGGGNMKDDVPIEIRLYYRDTENNKVTIGATTYTYSTGRLTADWDTGLPAEPSSEGIFAFVENSGQAGYAKHFNDVHLDIPQVKGTDPWAGKNIGIQLISTLTLADLDPVTGRAGGFWDLDNVRLTKSLPGPDFTGDSFVNLEDFAVMAQEWLSCTETTTDLTGDGCVNMEDLLVLGQSWLGSIYRPDFTGDSFVNLEDVAVMAQEWLSCTETTTDLTGDGCVNMQDLLVLGQSWLESI
jgi:hypothetical protein